MQQFILGDKNSIKRNSYIWNIIGGLINAFQSVIILIVLTRVLDIEMAGIFTIAWAIANLAITIGKYGVRNYQVTDISEKFTFNDYLSHRILVSVLMIIFTIVYIAFQTYTNDYSLDKIIIIFLMCYLKLVDSVEDVFHGMYQQKNRLDIAGKCISVRLIISTLMLCIFSILTQNLIIASILTCIFTTLILFYLLKISYPIFSLPKIHISYNKSWLILKYCFPIFGGSFLSFYILNAPKYAIDALLTSELQAYYGFISMPVFVIGLLNNFAFQPILTTMTICYEENDIKKFETFFWRQIIFIIFITVLALLGSYFLGIPILSLLYNCDLSLFRLDLLILMLGGGLLALVGFFTTIITLMRNQKIILIGYIIVGLLALFSSNFIVYKYQLRGASILYLFLILILTLFFSSFLLFRIRKWKENIYVKE